ncbi:MAG: ABC transporter permease, partial [Clostridia bacterium]
MKKVFVHLKDYKKECTIGPLFKLLEACFELFIPLVVASMVDVGIKNQDIPYILQVCAVLIGLGLLGLASSLTAQYFAAKAATGFGTKLRHSFLSHIQSFSYKDIDNVGTSTLITRITSDINQVQTGVNLVIRLLLRSPFVVVGAMVMAFTIDFDSGLIFLIAIPLLCLVVFGVMGLTIPMYKKVQANLDGVTMASRENLSGVRVLRAFCREQSEIDLFEEQTKRLNKMQNFVARITAVMNPITFVVVNFSVIALMYTGAIKVEEGGLSQGQVLALY